MTFRRKKINTFEKSILTTALVCIIILSGQTGFIRGFLFFCQKQSGKEETIMKYTCVLCGYEYSTKKGDPENGIEPGTDFEDLPNDWVCPLCGASKEDFEQTSEDDDE